MLITTLLLLVGAVVTVAQDTQLQQVNAIKKDKRYAYGEATHEVEDSAFLLAIASLKLNLESRLNAQTGTQVSLEVLQAQAKRITRPMGAYHRVMAYVEVEAVKATLAKHQEGAAPKPRVAVQLPQVEQASDAPAAPAASPANPATPDGTAMQGQAAALSGLVTSLMATEHLQAAIAVLDRGKRAGTLTQYAPITKTEHPELMYLLIFDDEYNIPLAVLSPEKDNGKRDNLASDKEEKLDDYKGKLAVCFSLAP